MEKRYFSIRFNWAEVLFYGFFIAYGYFGALAPSYESFASHIYIGFFSLTVLSLLSVLLGVIAWKWGETFESTIVISRRDLIVFFALAALLFALSNGSMGFSIQGDEVAYSMAAHGHAVALLLKFSDRLSILNSLPFRHLVQFVSLVMAVSLLLFIYFSRKLPWISRIALVLVALLGCRLAIILFGGNPNPHPPLGGIPLLVSGAFFGISDFSLKLSYFIAFSLFVFAVYKLVSRIADWRLSMLFALSVGTIPLLLHLAGIVENSIWSSICFTLVMAEIVINKKPNLAQLACFVSIMTLMRETAFLGYIPILVLFIATVRKSPCEYRWGHLRYIVAPSIVFIPFLAQSILLGTPATVPLNSEANVLWQIVNAMTSGVVLVAIANSVPIWWIIFIPYSFLCINNNRAVCIAFAAFFIISVVMYYSIRPELYGLAKYQAEYAVPFSIAGALLLFKKLALVRAEKILIVMLSALVGFNMVEYLRIPYGNKPADVLVDTMARDSKEFNAGYRILCGIAYDYKNAYSDIIKQGLSKNSYSVGVTYGVFPEIINGYSLEAVRQANSIHKLQQKLNNETGVPWTSASVANIESDPRIKVVVLGAVSQRDGLIKDFIKRGWVIQSTHVNAEYGSSVVTIKRPV